MFKFKTFALTLGALGLLSTAAFAAPTVGEAAPAFTAKDASGKTVNLEDFKGKTVVLEWSNHDCPFVIKHYDSGNMQAVQKQAKADGVEWVKIISSAPGRQGHVSDAKALEIVDKDGSQLTTVIRDEAGEIGRLYDAKTTPHMFVIDKDGNLAYAGAIDSNSSPRQSVIKDAKNYVLAALDDLEHGRAVEVAQTQPYGCSIKY